VLVAAGTLPALDHEQAQADGIKYALAPGQGNAPFLPTLVYVTFASAPASGHNGMVAVEPFTFVSLSPDR
jgi:hypothetical protein